MKYSQKIKEIAKEEKTQKIFEKVFDNQTIMTIHDLAKKGFFDTLEFVISTGKEAHVFRAKDVSGNFRAVKIYKIQTSEFKNMEKYIYGDQRFKKIKKTKKQIVFEWAKKEFKNLHLCRQANASTPNPITVKNNVLVMEFIGKNGIPAKTLKELPPKNQELAEKMYKQVIEFIARIFYLKELIHADLSEYNILVQEKKLVFIDLGQAVLSSHKNAQEFFNKDTENIARFFSRHKIEKTHADIINDIKKTGNKIKTEDKTK